MRAPARRARAEPPRGARRRVHFFFFSSSRGTASPLLLNRSAGQALRWARKRVNKTRGGMRGVLKAETRAELLRDPETPRDRGLRCARALVCARRSLALLRLCGQRVPDSRLVICPGRSRDRARGRLQRASDWRGTTLYCTAHVLCGERAPRGYTGHETVLPNGPARRHSSGAGSRPLARAPAHATLLQLRCGCVACSLHHTLAAVTVHPRPARPRACCSWRAAVRAAARGRPRDVRGWRGSLWSVRRRRWVARRQKPGSTNTVSQCSIGELYRNSIS